MSVKKINSALISVYDKSGLDPIIKKLEELDINIYSTGGTQKYIESLGVEVKTVESLTDYPSILDGRVKTLHPKVFGGILARREEDHIAQLESYDIPQIDLVIVDLYPFEETLKNTSNESEIIEKIDIGGISLIRAAAKNYKDVLVVASKEKYSDLLVILENSNGNSTEDIRKEFAIHSFDVSSHYDTAIFNYFNIDGDDRLKMSIQTNQSLRYGENPHQHGAFYGDLSEMFEKISGKELSFNNLVDIDAAVNLMAEFLDEDPCFAVLKHTNACGLAVRPTVLEAWKAALAGDPISAFGGILICNSEVDVATAQEIDKIFYEVLIAPSFSEEAIELLSAKKKRVLLKIKHYTIQNKSFKSLLNGVIQQDSDLKSEVESNLEVKTKKTPTSDEITDLLFANKCAKHLKSNTIVIAKNKQLQGMGCGQTSRVDACKQAILKAKTFGFSIEGAVLASDAFFPFPDCVELAHNEGINTVIQPGGSIKDQLSIDFCDNHEMSMVFTGSRHFKH
jgi:phosphoribosylaminoimidazolecarboxamide formyltransferase/IMP cyclohydrolase